MSGRINNIPNSLFIILCFLKIIFLMFFPYEKFYLFLSNSLVSTSMKLRRLQKIKKLISPFLDRFLAADSSESQEPSPHVVAKLLVSN